MKPQALPAFLLLASLTLLSCRKIMQPASPTQKVEFILKMSAPDWLLRQSARPISPNLLATATELEKDMEGNALPPMDVLEPILTSHGWLDSLVHWLPDVVRALPELGTPMNQLRRAYEAAINKVQKVAEKRLSYEEPQIFTDKQGRLHVVTATEDNGYRLQNLLLAQGELGFYETRSYAEVIEAMQRLRAASYGIENGDTTFDLFLLNVDYKDSYGQVTMELGIQADRPVIFFAQAADTARVMQIFRSDSARQFFPPQTAFAWGMPTAPDHPDVYPLIALKTNLEGKPRLDGSHVTHARQDFMPATTEAMVSVEMDEKGAAEWGRFTRGSIGRCVAIVFDGVVRTYPTVQTEITGGRSQITGNFTVDEAKDLANILKGGAYPAPVELVEMNVISIKP